MIEVFAGGAVLCSVAKSCGLNSSIAIDKIKKPNARPTILQLNLLLAEDRTLLETWLESPLLAWVHLAPVCGTASRAQNLQKGPADPQPLRSLDYPEGLPSLNGDELIRVGLANDLYEYSCFLFLRAAVLGVLVTLENPSNSYFWFTIWLRSLIQTIPVFHADFQACMLDGQRDKWIRIMANFSGISQLNIKCDRQHVHAPWGKTKNADGKLVWATGLEAQYPRKMCVALVASALQQLTSQGLQMRPQQLSEIAVHPLMIAQQARIAAGNQPRAAKIPPLVPQFPKVVVGRLNVASPCPLLSKTPKAILAKNERMQDVTVPAHSRFLRCTQLPDEIIGVEKGQVHEAKKPKRECADAGWPFEAAFGLPWTTEDFISKAASNGHPRHFCNQVPVELEAAIQKHAGLTDVQMSGLRIAWCRKWLARAAALEKAEAADRSTRPVHVQQATKDKRLLLTAEILADMGYRDSDALQLLREGSPLAVEIQATPVFKSQYKPCMSTMSSA